jgi:hypothetical protein
MDILGIDIGTSPSILRIRGKGTIIFSGAYHTREDGEDLTLYSLTSKNRRNT